MNKWDFLYGEEVFDEEPNSVGIISNGKGVLFYHGYYPDTESEESIFEIYASLQEMINGGEKIISFPWSAENEEKLIKFLNSLPEDADVYSDESELLNFKPEEMK